MADRGLQAERETYRVPLYQEDQVTGASTFLSPFGQGQRFVNCIPQLETNPVTKEGSFLIQKRVGLKATSSPLINFFTGMAQPKDNITITQLGDVNVAAVYNHDTAKILIIQYLPATGTTKKIGEFAADVRDYCFLTELVIAGVPTLGVVWTKYDKSTSKAYYATSSAGEFSTASLTQITDTSFPTELGTPMVLTGPMVQLNFTVYVLTTSGYIYNSDLNSISSWDDLGNIQTYAAPDKGVGLMRYKHHIVAFSEDSVEFFNDVGNPPPGSPLERTQQAFIKFGCVDPQCMLNVDDNLYWIASSSHATDGLWKLEGYTPVKVSNAAQDMQISSAFTTAFNSYNIYLRTISMLGTNHIIITGIIGYANVVYNANAMAIANPDDNNPADEFAVRTRMLAYCVDYGTWWAIFDHGDTNISIWLPCAYQPIAGGDVQNKYLQFVMKGSDIGNGGNRPTMYTLESSDAWNYFHDQSPLAAENDLNMIQASIQVHPIEFQTLKRKFIHKLSVSMEPIKSSVTPSYMYIIYSKDENTSTSSVIRFLSMVSTASRYYINKLGSCRRVQFALVNKSDHAWVVRAIELEVSQGTA